MDFAKIAEIFPGEEPGVLCKLSEMEIIRPSNVHKLELIAPAAQIWAFLRVAEVSASKERRGGRSEASKTTRRSVTPDKLDVISLIVDLKKGPRASSGVANVLVCPTDQQSGFVKALNEVIPPKDGGNKLSSVEFSKQFQDKILSF